MDGGPRQYIVKLKSGRELVTEKFDTDEAVLRWIRTGAAMIMYRNENVHILPDDIQSIQRIEDEART